VVRGFLAAWNANDLDRVVAFLHEEVVYHNVPLAAIHGRAAVDSYLRSKGGFDWVDWKLLALAASGTVVLTERIDDFSIGGRRVSLPVMGSFQVVDERIKVWRDYFDLSMYRAQLQSES
jgi:limonene-1,2-epoxide hydrolase